MNEQKIDFFFLSHKIEYFRSTVTSRKISQKNLGCNLLKVSKKVMLVVSLDKNQLQLIT